MIAAEPDLVRRMAAVVAETGVAVSERPAVVKAAIVKIYAGLDAATLDLLFKSEAPAWVTKPLTEAQVLQEIASLKAYALAPPGIEAVVPGVISVWGASGVWFAELNAS